MSNPRFYLRVAKDLLEAARKAIEVDLHLLAAISLVLSTENSVYSVISCFKPPSKIEDPIIELNLLIEEYRESMTHVNALLKDFIEISQYVIYTYKELVMRGDIVEEIVPSQAVTRDEVLEILSKVEKVVRVAEEILERCS